MAESQLRQATGGTGGSEYSYDAAVGDVYMTLYLKSQGAGQFGGLSPDERRQAAEALADMNARLDPEIREQAMQAAFEYAFENANAVADPNTSVLDFRKLYNTQSLGQLGKALAGISLSLPQIAKGRKILKGNEMPKFPEYEKDPAVSNRINEIRRQMEAGDPQQRAVLEDQAAQVFRQAQAVSKVTGQVGDFISGSQAGAAQQARQAREGVAQLSALDRARQGALDNMIRLGVEENRFAHMNRVNEFNQALYPEFVARRQAGEDLVNAGITNLYNSIGGAMQAAPMFAMTQQMLGASEVPPPQPTVYGQRVAAPAPPPAALPPAGFGNVAGPPTPLNNPATPAPSFGIPAASLALRNTALANPFTSVRLAGQVPSFGLPAASYPPLF